MACGRDKSQLAAVMLLYVIVDQNLKNLLLLPFFPLRLSLSLYR
jgi:hypothetical protein